MVSLRELCVLCGDNFCFVKGKSQNPTSKHLTQRTLRINTKISMVSSAFLVTSAVKAVALQVKAVVF